MLALIRISLPDRPGSLGRLTSTIGTAGADIAAVDVLESESGRALDDVTVSIRDAAHLDAVAEAVAGLAGMELAGVRAPVPPVTGHADLQLVEQVLCRPGTAPRTLVDGAPGALGADWAALIEYAGDPRGIVACSDGAPLPELITPPGPLRLAALPPIGASRTGGAALVPLGQPDPTDGGAGLGLLLGRDRGPGFHRSELWRLGQLGHVVALAVTTAVTAADDPG